MNMCCEENCSETLNNLIEIASLLYVLETALNHANQPTNDTTPFYDLAEIIRLKTQALIEKLTDEEIVKK